MHHPPCRPHRASQRLVQSPPVLHVVPKHDAQSSGASERSYRLDASPGLGDWMRSQSIGLALSTYELGKVITLGAGPSGLNVFDASFDSAMAMLHTPKGLYLSTHE